MVFEHIDFGSHSGAGTAVACFSSAQYGVKILGLNPAPDMTLLLVMLHTGTMFAVIVHFWKSCASPILALVRRLNIMPAHYYCHHDDGDRRLNLATYHQGLFLAATPDFEIESLFSNSKLIACGLVVSGILIIVSSRIKESHTQRLSLIQSVIVGMVQGLCLPFSGYLVPARHSTALSVGVARKPQKNSVLRWRLC
jgi:undecaprenyl-diphosphatase